SEPVRVLARPLVSELARDREPVSVLEKEICSVKLETEESDSVSVLNKEICSLRLDAEVSEPVKVLKIEECSTRTEDKPNEPDKPLAKHLISEPARESDPVRVL